MIDPQELSKLVSERVALEIGHGALARIEAQAAAQLFSQSLDNLEASVVDLKAKLDEMKKPAEKKS